MGEEREKPHKRSRLGLVYYPLNFWPAVTALASCFLLLSARQTEASPAMKRLFEDLFTDYNRLILPVASNKTKVTVTLGLKLGQILDLNLKQQILSTNVWVEQTWHDYKLQWSPDEYEGIDMIHVPAENLWIPDIVLFNNADGNYELTLVAKARLYSNGTVVWKPPTMFRSTCEIDVEYFPFDIQTCYLRFGSWTYAGDELELKHVGEASVKKKKNKVEIGIDLSQFYKNVEWDIIDVPAYYNENYYECCTEPFPDITFKIVIRRKMLFYLVNLILPVALMTFMTVSVFYLPSDSNEKVTLSISILTSLIVFFLLMLEIIPASSLAVPLFGKYLLFTLALVSLSACVSVYVLNIHHRSPSVHSMSPRIRHIFLKVLPRLLRLDRPDPRERSSLNRFRKKKIAQQLLSASQSSGQHATHKVYDLAQPLAASLNLLETLHRGQVNPKDDNCDQTKTKGDDDEGRYFRRYVDDYIERLKKVRKQQQQQQQPQPQPQPQQQSAEDSSAGCCSDRSQQQPQQSQHYSCCARANQPRKNWRQQVHPAGQRIMSNPMRTGDVSCNCTGRRSQLAQTSATILQDDTLDMTFECDDQPVEDSELPSPPPPPPLRQLAQQQPVSGRLSSCSVGRLTSGLSSDESIDQGDLVDLLISRINLINTASDDIDTTTTSASNPDEQPATILQQQQLGQPTACACGQQQPQLLQHPMQQPSVQTNQTRQPLLPAMSSSSSRDSQAANQVRQAKQPSDLLLSLRLSYDRMPAHVRAAIRSILFIADTIKNEDDENSAIEDWESMSMVVDRLFLWIFLLLCTFGSVIILALAPSLYDQRASIDDELRIDVPPSNCSAGLR